MNLSKVNNPPSYGSVIDAIACSDAARVSFLKACLQKLGLQVNEEEQAVPSLSRLHLSAHQPSDVSELISSWQGIITLIDSEEHIKAENDTFHLEKPGAWVMDKLTKAVTAVLPVVSTEKNEAEKTNEGDETATSDKITDYDKVIKKVIVHERELPSSRETPCFNHHGYYANLAHYHSKCANSEPEFGKHLLYGEVVTSTNTLLEKYVHIGS